jgi:hypothetical protein
VAAARRKLLPCLAKRDLLNDSGAPSKVLIEEGEAFLQNEWLQDALELFGKAGYKEGIGRILDRAVEAGDFFLAKAAADRLGEPLAPAQWSTVGQKALEDGKVRFALNAFRQAEDAEGVKRAQELINHDGSGV